jgi:hypothetical protein
MRKNMYSFAASIGPPQSTWRIYGHSLCLVGGQMGAGHVTELSGAVLGPASGSAQVGGPRVLSQREEGGPGLPAAEALVPGMFPPRLS